MRRRTLISGISIVKSLLHFDTTTLTKDEVSGNSWTYNRANRNTTYKKFGNSSVELISTTIDSYILFTNPVLDPDKDFTIDFWIRRYSATSSGARVIFDLYDSTNISKYIILDCTSNKLNIRNTNITYSSDGYESINYSLSPDDFSYVAIYYKSDSKTAFFRIDNNISSSIPVPNIDFNNLTIRLFSDANGDNVLRAYIDEFRIREGVADPTEAIPTEAGTL